jgi:hydrogenase-4 component B
MFLILITLSILVVSGLLSLAFTNSRHWSPTIAIAGVTAGCACAVSPVWAVLTGAPPLFYSSPWNVPGGAFSLGMDGLTAFFCLPIIILSPLAAFYGRAYLAHDTKSPGSFWFFFNLLIASMLLVVTARNGILFLASWELMTVCSFLLVIHDHERESVRTAGWIYLTATHIGAAALFAFFIILGETAGSLEFQRIMDAGVPAALTGTLFVLALIGFGMKAGFMPLHIWLPEAHPAAPSPVSALMSGVMIKLGIYGLLRSSTFLGTPPPLWGWTFIGIGLISGILGIANALGQRDLKRLLAYSSVENIGIISLGMGAGFLGLAWTESSLTVFGFGGALLHVFNHTLCKGLLFLGAGNVLHGTGSLDIDRLGGLMKRMPWTGTVFLTGAAAISGLPPFNCFASEFLLYAAGITGVLANAHQIVLPAAGILAGLAMTGGLTAAAFAKGAGMVFLGEPRGEEAAHAHEVSNTMRFVPAILAACCLAAGCASFVLIRLAFPALRLLSGGANLDAAQSAMVGMLTWISALSGLTVVVIAGLFVLRRLLPRARTERINITWDCGYAQPSARMEYTGSSFAQPLVLFFSGLTGSRNTGGEPQGFFPAETSFETAAPDIISEGLFAPLFKAVDRLLTPVRVLQHGRIHLYVLYVALTLIALLVWYLGFGQ